MAPAPLRVPQGAVRARGGMQERPAALPALTGLRFVAAFLVLAGHYVLGFRAGLLPAGPLTTLVAPLLDDGAWAVGLFFVLSGFVLAYSYLDAGGRVRTTGRAFWGARLARVYPVYLACCSVGLLPFLWSGAPHTGRTLLATLALLQSWLPAQQAGLDGPGWSLSTEAGFYLLFPLLAPLLGRRRTRTLLLLLALLWLLALCGPLLYVLVRPDGPAMPYTGRWFGLLTRSPLTRLPEFLLGVGAALLWARSGAWWQAQGGRVAPYALLALALALVGLHGLPLIVRHNGLYAPLFCVLLCALAGATAARGTRGAGAPRPGPGPRRSLLAAVLGSRPLVGLGRASYALYLIHYPLYDWLAHTAGVPPATSARALVFGAGYGLLATALALVLCAAVEEPARRRLLRPRRHGPPAGRTGAPPSPSPL